MLGKVTETFIIQNTKAEESVKLLRRLGFLVVNEDHMGTTLTGTRFPLFFFKGLSITNVLKVTIFNNSRGIICNVSFLNHFILSLLFEFSMIYALLIKPSKINNFNFLVAVSFTLINFTLYKLTKVFWKKRFVSLLENGRDLIPWDRP